MEVLGSRLNPSQSRGTRPAPAVAVQPPPDGRHFVSEGFRVVLVISDPSDARASDGASTPLLSSPFLSFLFLLFQIKVIDGGRC